MTTPVALNQPPLLVRAELPSKIVHLMVCTAAIALVGIPGDLFLTVAVFLLIVALIAEGIRTVRVSALRQSLRECDYQKCPSCGANTGKDRRLSTCPKCDSALPTGKLRDWWECTIDP